MNLEQEEIVKELVTDWMSQCAAVSSEFSWHYLESYKHIVHRGKVWIARLGIEWSDDLIPTTIAEILQDLEEGEEEDETD